ncbi:X2-like carbohydrate binding domain-containing protein [Paenibacillus humicola]|uniref:X2-like carbohydrate binding domain-containing protein n=1 Tax=Paenibacillus humicola TaxID=3110540 RepID=UPI00237C3729|nr:X2-like carbohydrate binding domain-containing protein [Paenibacillus humicola]
MNRLVRKTWLGLLLAAVIIGQFGYISPARGAAEAADNGLAQKPYMGWSSYSMQVYDGQGNWTSEEKIKAMSDAMHKKLQSHGYNYINVDAGWNGSMDEYGRPVPSTTLYPHGFQNLINYVHHNGQKIGIYMIPGLSKDAYAQNLPIYGTQCHMQDIAAQPLRTADYWNIGYKIDFSNPCAQKYIDSIADELAAWGIDFVKFDSVTPGSGHNDTTIDARDDVAAWSKALSRHHIWFEISWALDHNYVDYWKKYANGWRVDWDVEAYNPEVGLTQWANIARLFPDAALWWRDAGPGGWNDFDSLDIGNGETSGLTRDERQTAMTLWAASAAQLYIGDDITNLDDYGLQLLMNDEVIAVNQAGHPIHPVSTATNRQVWYANNGDGTYTVALFNLGTKAARIGVNWSDIGLNGSASVRDLWKHKELGTFKTGLDPVYLEPHASALFKVTAKSGTSSVNDDDTGVRYTGNWARNGGKELVHDSQDLTVTIGDSAVQNSGAGGTSSTAAAANAAESGDVVNPGTVTAAVYDSDTVSHSVYLNDTEPSVSYSGTWGYSSGRPAGNNDYMNDVHYGQNSAEFQFTFTGTGVEFLTEQDAAGGSIDIDVDGQQKQAATAYDGSAHNVGQYVVYSVSGLPNVQHTLKGVKTGGTYLIVDGFKVTADSLLGTASGSLDRDQPADVTVTLPNGTASLTGIKNGSAALAKDTDYTVSGNSVTIKKDYLSLQPNAETNLSFAFAGGDSQTFAIAVTGASASTIDPAEATFDKKTSAQADVTTKLALNGNTLTGIQNGGAALTEGTDYTVSGDTVTIGKSYLAQQPVGDLALTFEFSAGAAQTLTIHVINSASPGRFLTLNNDAPGISYTGSWNHSGGRNFGDYMDDVQWTETNGDFFEYTFKGTGIQYITEIDPSEGLADVYIDGVLTKTIDTHADVRQPQQAVFSATGLTDGLHTIKVVKKSGQFMLLDTLKVQKPDLIDISEADFNPSAPADVTVNVIGSIANLDGIANGTQALVNGEDYTVSGNAVTIKKEYLAAQPAGTTNLTFSFKGDYMDDVHYTETNGDYFVYGFKGTGIDLIMPMGPNQGEMDVYIDGSLRKTVNAFAEARSSQQTVFSVSGLKAGTHSIKVVKKSGGLMLADELKFTVSR